MNTMATKLLNFTFFGKTPQHLKKFWDVGVTRKGFASRGAAVNPKIDRFIEKAKQQKYRTYLNVINWEGSPVEDGFHLTALNRSRSAYKLIEFDEKYQLLKPGFKVLDIGAAPGSWSEFLACRTNSNKSDPNSPVGTVIAVDTETFDDIEGVITLPNTDFLKEASQNKILGYLGQGQKFDFICSDMVTESGVEAFDRERLKKLVYFVIMFSVKNLKPGGGVLVKVWDKGERGDFKNDMKNFFESVEFVGIKGTKMNFSETYVIGTNFQGLSR